MHRMGGRAELGELNCRFLNQAPSSISTTKALMNRETLHFNEAPHLNLIGDSWLSLPLSFYRYARHTLACMPVCVWVHASVCVSACVHWCPTGARSFSANHASPWAISEIEGCIRTYIYMYIHIYIYVMYHIKDLYMQSIYVCTYTLVYT